MARVRKDESKIFEHRYQLLFVLLSSIQFLLVLMSALLNGVLGICPYNISTQDIPDGEILSRKRALLNDVMFLRKYTECLWTFNGYSVSHDS
jgi:hypothetical protein